MMLVQLEPMVMWASQSLFVMGALQQLLDPDHPAVIALQIVLELRGGRRGHRGGVVRDDRFPLPDPGQALLHQRGVPGRVRRGLRRRPEVVFIFIFIFWTQQHKRCPDQREPSSGHGEPHGAAHVQLPVGRGKGRGVKNPPQKTSKSLCHCFYISGRAVALVQGWVGRHEMARSDR